MSPMNTLKTAAVGCMMLGAFACSNDNRQSANTPNPNATPPENQAATSSDQSKPAVTLVGCLQRGSGHNDFILTHINEPGRSVGTSGQASGNTVEQSQLREARNAYSLDPQGDVKLDDLVGKQVRITGNVTERSDLPAATSGTSSDQPNAKTPATDKDNRRSTKDRTDIDQSDLTKVDVTAASATGQPCGK